MLANKKGETMSVITTKHASLRLQQRGFQNSIVELIKEYGVEKHKPGNALELSIPRKKIAECICDLKHKINHLEKCRNKALLFSSNGSLIITAYNIY